MRFPAVLLVLALLVFTPEARADALDPPTVAEPVAPPVVTRHSGVFNGQRIRYAATVGETILTNDAGQPAATIFSIAYVREGVRNPAMRPVLFVFNGGPGASSSPLHLGAFGPKRSPTPQPGAAATGTRVLVDNPHSILSDTDLVFIDPVGAGFARLLPGGDGRSYWSIEGDAAAVLGFIRNWLRDNRRTASPKFIAGESYGGTRLATLLDDAEDLGLSGALFLSPLLDLSASIEAQGNDLPYILRLPSMAAVAWYHRRGSLDGDSLPEVFERAADFALGDYAAALLQGARLAPRESERVSREVARIIGVDQRLVADSNLRVPLEDFLMTLLPGTGLRVSRLDGRVTGEAAALVNNPPPYNDPSFALGGSIADLITRYLVDELGFRTERRYVPFAADVNAAWSFTAPDARQLYFTVTPAITEAMRENSRLRLFVGGGYFDLATPILGPRHALDHAGLPPGRVTTAYYEAGHSVFDHEPSLRQLSADVRRFIAGAGQ